MELLPILDILWRRRVVVAVGLLVASTAALLIGYKKPPTPVIASSRVVLDTVRSQLVNADPEGADTLPWRAATLTAMMTSDTTRTKIATEIGAPTNRVVVVDATLSTPLLGTTLAVAAAKAAAVKPEPFVLTLRAGTASPLIDISGIAPDRAGSARLVAAATRMLTTSGSPRDS